jgi:hypothetical protein
MLCGLPFLYLHLSDQATRERFAKVGPGMSREEVRALLGPPRGVCYYHERGPSVVSPTDPNLPACRPDMLVWHASDVSLYVRFDERDTVAFCKVYPRQTDSSLTWRDRLVLGLRSLFR